MRAYVLPDARLAKLAGRVVRLDIDTEKPGNAPFVEKFPIDAWPTLLAVDPATEEVILRWAGTATVAQVERLARDAERALRAGRASRADATLARADRLLGERRHAEAAAAYREALQAGGKGWERRERAAEALVQATGFSGDAAACAAAARQVLPTLAPGAAAARVAATGLGCARELEDEAARAAALDGLEPLARKALAADGVLADDRSWLYDELAQARAARGDPAGAKALARRWLAFLEGEASRARTPLARSAFDGPRLQAAIRAGEPARALPALLASERDLPNEFTPPTNLGVLYLELGRPQDALAAAERALARAQGPRRIRVLVLEAQAQDALGDRAAARATLERALSEAEAMPEATRPKGYTSRARKLLADMGGGAG
jgi:tetratricopeptide (TPR) repeat protein